MSTRLILKNLPKNADEARVRELFKAKGDVTDVKVVRTKDGRSRCFGFVGFKDKQQAADAQKYFDKACMGSCRMQVSFAEPYKGENTVTEAACGDDGTKPEPGSIMDSSKASTKAQKREQLLQEFLGVNRHKSKHQMHANDEVNPAIDPVAAHEDGGVAAAAEDEDSDVTKHDLDEMDDMEYLRSRMGKLDSGAEVRNSEQDMPEAVPADDRPPPTDFEASAAAIIRETRKLFVRNLPFVTTENDLLALMEGYGNVTDVKVIRDTSTGVSRGYALVYFRNADSAIAAYEDLDGKPFQGRLLHIMAGLKSKEALPEVTEAEAPKQGGYKAERDSKRKANAGDRQVWSTFFMREDTVAQAVADLLGITKAELLDPEAPDAAVRLALGETQVIEATKKELAEAGVKVGALESAARASGHAAANSNVKRSTSVLLVKNLPSEATEDALEDLFAKHGTVVRVTLPRTKALAVVEMSDEQSAKRAFKRLAYKRFLHVPLYLEYAPEDVLDEAAAQITGGGAGEGKTKKSGPLRDADLVEADEEPPVDVDTPDCNVAMSTTLYIKNISFETSQKAFEKHCRKVAKAVGGVLRAVAVPSKKATSSSKQAVGEKQLLQGFAFAEFGDQHTAEAALKRLQGTTLDGHKLQVEFSRQESGGGKKSAVKRERDSSETKLMVRNLAFEATSKDVRRLMEAFGHVKTCRLPKKFDGTTRGFAFVEFATKGEAQRAMESAYGTHLYGRRLLLEYAKGEEGVGELRSKAQKVR